MPKTPLKPELFDYLAELGELTPHINLETKVVIGLNYVYCKNRNCENDTSDKRNSK